MKSTVSRAAVVALAMMLPVAMHAQRGGRGMGQRPGMGPRSVPPGVNSIAPLIDMRRELNLSSRQLVQLDSIERGLLARNKEVRDRIRPRLDSMRPRGSITTEQEIQAYRAQADSMRALRRVIAENDSIARGRAMAILSDSQRVQVRERMAERRGFAAGRMSRMGEGRRGGPPRGELRGEPRGEMRGRVGPPRVDGPPMRFRRPPV